MSLHLITQNNQPYGSTRRCCERCGLSVYVINDKIGENWTDEVKKFLNSPLSCNKLNLTK